MQFWNSRQKQLQEEIQSHIDLEIEDNLRSGMSAEAARHAAQKNFGNTPLALDRSREVWGALWLQYLLQDLRFALRTLRRAPGYAAAVIVTVALGLGSVATMLAIVDSVLLRPIPLSHPRQLVMIYGKSQQPGSWEYLTYRQIDTLRRDAHSFSAVAGYASTIAAVGTSDGARWALLSNITPGFFSMLGVSPKMGRVFDEEDISRPVALINDQFWQDRFHGDPRILGSTLKIAGQARTIVGVMPSRIDLPFDASGPIVYEPLSLQGEKKGLFFTGAFALARLRSGVSIPQALAETRSLITHNLDRDGVDDKHLAIQTVSHFLTASLQAPLLALLGGVALLLLIACANAANLQIARATERLPEMQTSIPFSGYSVGLSGTTDVSGRPFHKGDDASYSIVSSSFVRTSGIHLLQGRGFLPQDDSSAAMVALVNHAFVRKYLSGRNPLGVTLGMHRDPDEKLSDLPLTQSFTVVGVVQNEMQGQDLASPLEPMIYLDDLQLPSDSELLQVYGMVSQFAIRSPLPQNILDREIRATLQQVAPGMAEMRLSYMEEAIANSLGERRLALRLVSGFGGMALLLAAIGVYGLLAYAVTLRRREIGIRMALGSSRAGVTRLILRQAARLVLWGLLPGIAGAWAAEHAVRSFLYGVTALDPLALSASVSVLVATAAVAATVPAWHAALVDPAEVLRAE